MNEFFVHLNRLIVVTSFPMATYDEEEAKQMSKQEIARWATVDEWSWAFSDEQQQ